MPLCVLVAHPVPFIRVVRVDEQGLEHGPEETTASLGEHLLDLGPEGILHVLVVLAESSRQVHWNWYVQRFRQVAGHVVERQEDRVADQVSPVERGHDAWPLGFPLRGTGPSGLAVV